MTWTPWKDKRTATAQTWPRDDCRHWRTEVKIGRFTALASGLMDRPRPDGLPGPEPWPDAGVYLDRGWLSHLGGMASAGVDSPIEPWWPFIVVDWPDQGAINADYYAALVDRVVEMLEAGQRVEIACQGGHGRTGTLLAGVLAKIESLPAQEAIDSLRKRYCKQAVESHKQVAQIYEYLAEEPPKAPTPKLATTTGLYLEPCKCGHEEYLHIESGGACVDCDCEGYVPTCKAKKRAATPWDMKPCDCRHVRRNHQGKIGQCRKCACSQYRPEAVERDEIA